MARNTTTMASIIIHVWRFYPDNKDSAIYLKRILVPFGEYNPFKLFKFQFTSTNFSPGEECSIINTENGNIGCAICFESVFPEASVDCVKAGAEVITVLTNDSWLGERLPLYQHHTHSIIRAVETNRYILTSTNTGISSVISNCGEIKSETDYNNEAVIEDTFLYDKRKFYIYPLGGYYNFSLLHYNYFNRYIIFAETNIFQKVLN